MKALSRRRSRKTLRETLEAELGERRVPRSERLLRAAKLPPGKTFDLLDAARLPKGVGPRLRELAGGDFIVRIPI